MHTMERPRGQTAGSRNRTGSSQSSFRPWCWFLMPLAAAVMGAAVAMPAQGAVAEGGVGEVTMASSRSRTASRTAYIEHTLARWPGCTGDPRTVSHHHTCTRTWQSIRCLDRRSMHTLHFSMDMSTAALMMPAQGAVTVADVAMLPPEQAMEAMQRLSAPL